MRMSAIGRRVDFADLFTEDGIHELPFAPPGVPAVLTGRAAIRDYLSAIVDTPLRMRHYDNTIHDTADPATIRAAVIGDANQNAATLHNALNDNPQK